MDVTNEYTFRARSSYIYFGLTAFLLIFLVGESILVPQTLSSRVASLALATIIGVGAYLIFLRPKVVVFDEGITIVNPLTEITVGWDRVDAIETKYSMSIECDGKVIYAWAAPAPGRHHRRLVDPGEMRGMAHGGHPMIRPGDDPDSISGSAAAIARRRLAEFKNNDVLAVAYSKQRTLIGPAIIVVSAVTFLFLR